MKANVFEIKRFAVHDGPGIRTTVFFKGCPLRCLWCHNPEGLLSGKQTALFSHKCSSCRSCVSVCSSGSRGVDGEGELCWDAKACLACGRCAQVCPSDASVLYGREISVEDLSLELLEDREFYEASRGGITLSGGECLLQSEACEALLKRLKQEGVHTAVDTCGYVDFEAFERVIPYTDLFLYDVKAFDGELHRRLTGVSNHRILENLTSLSQRGCPVEIRIPFVPDGNADQIPLIARFLSSMEHLVGVRLLPYHNFAKSKYRALQMKEALPESLPTQAQLAEAKRVLESFGLKVLE